MARLLYHLTFAADWAASRPSGLHAMSGRGMTLEQQGFVHLCFADQVPGVVSRYWQEPTAPVVLLTVDPDLLPHAVVLENTSGGAERFPHFYGPLPVTAVVASATLPSDGRGGLVLPVLPDERDHRTTGD